MEIPTGFLGYLSNVITLNEKLTSLSKAIDGHHDHIAFLTQQTAKHSERLSLLPQLIELEVSKQLKLK